MNNEQLRVHLAVTGWAAYIDPNGFNLTHPEHGTVWMHHGGVVSESRLYMYGLDSAWSPPADIADAPDKLVATALRRMEAHHDS